MSGTTSATKARDEIELPEDDLVHQKYKGISYLTLFLNHDFYDDPFVGQAQAALGSEIKKAINVKCCEPYPVVALRKAIGNFVSIHTTKETTGSTDYCMLKIHDEVEIGCLYHHAFMGVEGLTKEEKQVLASLHCTREDVCTINISSFVLNSILTGQTHLRIQCPASIAGI